MASELLSTRRDVNVERLDEREDGLLLALLLTLLGLEVLPAGGRGGSACVTPLS